MSEAEERVAGMPLSSIEDLVAATVALGAEHVAGLSTAEEVLIAGVSKPRNVHALREAIEAGGDPLGDAFCNIRSAEERRPNGQTFTPPEIVTAMLSWTLTQPKPDRVIDPGVGSGRFLMRAAAMYPSASLVGADLDPVAALMARANVNVLGYNDRTRIEVIDYRSLIGPAFDGRTLYVGNPPYVRHHGISPEWKQWLTTTALAQGYKASQLAGLHVHFFLATLAHASKGDYGSFVTSSEWLDVNYGSLVRQMLTDKLGGESVHVVDPQAMPFSDATTTAAITSFSVGKPVESIRLGGVKTLAELGNLTDGHPVARDRLVEAHRWTPLLRVTPKLPDGYIELGELARVHRGTVTGANSVWVKRRSETKLPESVLRASVTKARELFAAGSQLDDSSSLRVVIDLPIDLDELDDDDRKKVNAFLRRPQVKEAKSGYVASARRAWWAVGLRDAAPILATYMARRPPAFVRNVAAAGHINIAHGIYPRESMSDTAIRSLTDYLRVSVTLGQGRTYAGGLTKFEPREMERLPVPTLEQLSDASYTPELGRAAAH